MQSGSGCSWKAREREREREGGREGGREGEGEPACVYDLSIPYGDDSGIQSRQQWKICYIPCNS